MKTLRLRLCPLAELGAESLLDFEVLDDNRVIVHRGRAVPAEIPKHGRVELVVAAPDVLLVEAALPALSGSRLRAALPAIAEPHVLSDIESAFVVAANIGKSVGSRATLAVLDRALFTRALELLRRAKLEAATATPEQLALPLESGRWRLRLGTAYSVLRMGALRGIACSAPTTAAPVEVQLALQQSGETHRPQAIVVDGEFPAREWTDALGVPVIAPEAAEGRAEPVALELLQYELAPRLASWRAWRLPAAVAALLVLTWLVGLNIDAWLMRREESALRARMEATLRSTFPSTPVVLDPVAQMRRGVADLRAGAGSSDPRDFLPLASAVARAVPASDAVRALEFRDQVLRVDFEPRALEQPKSRDLLLEQISGAGLTGRFSEATLSVRAKGDGP
ncbi:MAG TPA: type II secretion system protein GspL [Burkholderiales bacterium]|nr:type II secretion system protein GspL [Burkholderiales bacterium]